MRAITNAPPDADKFLEELKGLAVGLVHGWDNKHGAKYNHKTLPEFAPIAKKVNELVVDVIAKEEFSKRNAATLIGWRIQAILLLALQCCMPPILGKTFWDLRMNPEKNMSM